MAAAHAKEPLNLLDKIEDSLTMARWVELTWTDADIIRAGRPNVGTAIGQNVEIEVEASQGASLLPIAKVLAKAISEQGVPATALFTNRNMPSQNHMAIHVIIGTKP